jgi:hypothetical protein
LRKDIIRQWLYVEGENFKAQHQETLRYSSRRVLIENKEKKIIYISYRSRIMLHLEQYYEAIKCSDKHGIEF